MVHDVATGGDDHRAGASTTPVSSNRFQATPATAPSSVTTRLVAPVSKRTSTPASSTRSPEQVHHDLGALGVAGHRHLVAARRRRDLLAERPHLLVAGVHQPLGAGLDDGLAGEEGPLELEAQRLEPVEVLDRSLAVGADLLLVGVLGAGHQVARHRVDGVLVAGRLLHGGPAAEVEVAAGHARRAAVDRGLLQQQHPRAGAGGLQGGAAAGDAEPDHDHVVGLGVGRDVAGGDGGGDGQSSGRRSCAQM